jgi:hypothetical protein
MTTEMLGFASPVILRFSSLQPRRRRVMRIRSNVRSLLALILLLGFGLAALKGATLIWATASILIALSALCSSTLGAIFRYGSSRPCWVGFAVFGWVYFFLHFNPWAQWTTGYGPAHFTTWAVDSLIVSRMDPELEAGRAVGSVEEFIILRSGRSGSFFCAVFHAIASLLFGLAGSTIGIILSESSEGRVESPRS